MALVLARRLLWMIPILLGISVIVFSMMHLAPGDPAEAILGPRGTEELLRQARRELGLDQPLHVQYGRWVLNAARGDLGESYRLNRPVAPEVLARFKNSALLAGVAFVVAVIARIMRSSMLEVVGQDYIRTARAKGLHDRAVVVRHALRNALIPVVAVVGLQVGYLLSAAALVEVVFSWPGLGSLLVQSVVQRDLPLTQGAVLVIAVVYVVVNILTDLIQ